MAVLHFLYQKQPIPTKILISFRLSDSLLVFFYQPIFIYWIILCLPWENSRLVNLEKFSFSPGGDQVSIGLDLGERYGKVALMLGDLMDRKNVTTRHTGINYKVFLHMLGGRLPGVSRFNYLE